MPDAFPIPATKDLPDLEVQIENLELLYLELLDQQATDSQLAFVSEQLYYLRSQLDAA